ncbi:MAG: hypothetical protein ABI633_11815, partial [Burkholderiales bacterium]
MVGFPGDASPSASGPGANRIEPALLRHSRSALLVSILGVLAACSSGPEPAPAPAPPAVVPP